MDEDDRDRDNNIAAGINNETETIAANHTPHPLGAPFRGYKEGASSGTGLTGGGGRVREAVRGEARDTVLRSERHGCRPPTRLDCTPAADRCRGAL